MPLLFPFNVCALLVSVLLILFLCVVIVFVIILCQKKKKNNVDQIDDKNASKCEKVFQIILKKRNEK